MTTASLLRNERMQETIGAMTRAAPIVVFGNFVFIMWAQGNFALDRMDVASTENIVWLISKIFIQCINICIFSALNALILSQIWTQNPVSWRKTRILIIIIASLILKVAFLTFLIVVSGELLSTSENYDALIGVVSIVISSSIFVVSLRTIRLDKLGFDNPVFENIVELQSRANVLLKRANIILIIIIGVLVSSALFIIFAGSITLQGTNIVNPIQKLVERREFLSASLRNRQKERIFLIGVYPELEKIQRMSPEETIRLPTINDLIKYYDLEEREWVFESRAAIDIEKRRSSLTSAGTDVEFGELNFAQVKIYISDLEDQILEIRKEINDITDKIHEWREKNLDSLNTEKPVDNNLLIATGIMRFCVLVISIYLVQILTGLYRYNTKLASHYVALADSLSLIEIESEDFEYMKQVLIPKVEFGNNPDPIHKSLIDSISQFFKREKSN